MINAMPIEVSPVCTTAEIITRNRIAGTVSRTSTHQVMILSVVPPI